MSEKRSRRFRLSKVQFLKPVRHQTSVSSHNVFLSLSGSEPSSMIFPQTPSRRLLLSRREGRRPRSQPSSHGISSHNRLCPGNRGHFLSSFMSLRSALCRTNRTKVQTPPGRQWLTASLNHFGLKKCSEPSQHCFSPTCIQNHSSVSIFH